MARSLGRTAWWYCVARSNGTTRSRLVRLIASNYVRTWEDCRMPRSRARARSLACTQAHLSCRSVLERDCHTIAIEGGPCGRARVQVDAARPAVSRVPVRRVSAVVERCSKRARAPGAMELYGGYRGTTQAAPAASATLHPCPRSRAGVATTGQPRVIMER